MAVNESAVLIAQSQSPYRPSPRAAAKKSESEEKVIECDTKSEGFETKVKAFLEKRKASGKRNSPMKVVLRFRRLYGELIEQTYTGNDPDELLELAKAMDAAYLLTALNDVGDPWVMSAMQSNELVIRRKIDEFELERDEARFWEISSGIVTAVIAAGSATGATFLGVHTVTDFSNVGSGTNAARIGYTSGAAVVASLFGYFAWKNLFVAPKSSGWDHKLNIYRERLESLERKKAPDRGSERPSTLSVAPMLAISDKGVFGGLRLEW
ncbi:hypothetical protein ACFL31_03160 [Candidatus Margulisiibacteriota bacterium]